MMVIRYVQLKKCAPEKFFQHVSYLYFLCKINEIVYGNFRKNLFKRHKHTSPRTSNIRDFWVLTSQNHTNTTFTRLIRDLCWVQLCHAVQVPEFF